MYIKKITLQNYRNYEHLEIDFNRFGNIIIGNNGHGKTNIIESIYVASLGKSFRTKSDIELIKFNQSYFSIFIEIQEEDISNTVGIITLNNGKKQIKVNGISLEKGIELIGKIKIVIFCQEDMQLLRGTPQDRRNQLDRFISLINVKYKNNLALYNKTLKQRNYLLKNIKKGQSKKEELDIWDNALAKFGSEIIIERVRVINLINNYIGMFHSSLSSVNENVIISYNKSDNCHSNINELNSQDLFVSLYTELNGNSTRDIRYGFTTVGPHKDDIYYSLNDKDARKYASQGQQRTLVLALKLTESEIIYSKFKSYPILLLDDVMSELDLVRQDKLLNLISKCQTIITTTDIKGINIDKKSEFYCFEVVEGRVNYFGGSDG